MKNGELTEQEQALLEKGLAPVALAAEKMKVHVGTVYRLIETEKLKEVRIGNRRYVDIASIYDHLGPEGAAALGLPKPKKAVR